MIGDCEAQFDKGEATVPKPSAKRSRSQGVTCCDVPSYGVGRPLAYLAFTASVRSRLRSVHD